MIIGAIHSDWVDDPVTQRTSTSTAVAKANLKWELLLAITFSTVSIAAPI
jgi:hypothetical protein